MKYILISAVSFFFVSSASAFTIRAKWNEVRCDSKIEANGVATLSILLSDKVVATISSGLTQVDANALGAFCEGIKNAAFEADKDSPITSYILIRVSEGYLDKEKALSNELRSNRFGQCARP
jgi:hypothetical protein